MFTKQHIEQYFFAIEQIHIFLSLLAVAITIAAAVFYWFIKADFFKGAAIGMIAFAFAFGSYGYATYKKTDRLRKVAIYNYDMHPEYLKSKELLRIKNLKTTITIIGIIHIFLIAIGLFMFYYFEKKNKILSGIFTSIMMMSILALVTCILIKNKTISYEIGILQFTKQLK